MKYFAKNQQSKAIITPLSQTNNQVKIINKVYNCDKKGRNIVKYITGIHALNLRCSLLTTGDWHCLSLKWEDITFGDTENSIFGDYGIEYTDYVPNLSGKHAVANHIRALLDLISMGNFALAGGMNKDFICNDNYNEEIFEKIMMMRNFSNWEAIDSFMGREYYGKWLEYKKENIV